MAYDYPYFMYDPDLMDNDDIHMGLCRGFLLIRVSLSGLSYAMLIVSSQAVEEMLFGSRKPCLTKHTTKDPIATKLGIMTITPEIIAYGACQVCLLLSSQSCRTLTKDPQAQFSLSSVSEWLMQDMTFDLQDFYYNVLFLFEEQDNEWACDTLAHYYKYVHFTFVS
jgi:hypothetical protein